MRYFHGIRLLCISGNSDSILFTPFGSGTVRRVWYFLTLEL